jgi:hypothetical protein
VTPQPFIRKANHVPISNIVDRSMLIQPRRIKTNYEDMSAMEKGMEKKL